MVGEGGRGRTGLFYEEDGPVSGRNHTVGGLFLPHFWAEWRQRNSLFSPFRPSPSSLLHPRSGGRKGPEGESEEVLNGKERRASGSVVFLAVSLPAFSEWSPSPSSTYCSTSPPLSLCMHERHIPDLRTLMCLTLWLCWDYRME